MHLKFGDFQGLKYENAQFFFAPGKYAGNIGQARCGRIMSSAESVLTTAK
jgi:hypothetical protein